RALLRAGMEVIVAEKADAIRAAGATLGLWANAVRVFDDLDVDVRLVGREAQMYFHGTSGQLLKTPEFGEEDHRYLLAHPASLNNLLAESVGYDNIRLEAAVAGFEEDQDRVTVRFADGSTERADLLIGADGLYSKVRAQLFPGTDAQEHAGHRAWRAIVKADHIGVPDDRLIVGGRHRTRGGYVRAPDGTVFWLLSRLLYVKAPAPDREPRLAELLARIRAEASYERFSTPAELDRLVRDDLAVLLSERFIARSAASAAPSSPGSGRLPADITSLVGASRPSTRSPGCWVSPR
ncbi:MAG TPA: FAD-dependent monooxygenase, partial [Streptosporangiaceae bacterium]|nr:FAD-dependent monooxygenase [Streptosporangiaceae bacterium]